jgi:SH3 domain protein
MDDLISRIAITFTFLVLSVSVLAETVYVQDSLRIGVRTEPGNNATPIGVVVTGMRLDVLDRNNDYVKIRTEKGLEGWIKESYVAKDVPAIIQLEELQKEYSQFKSRVGKHDELLKSSEIANKSLSTELEELKTSNAELQRELVSVKATHSQSAGPYVWLILSYVLIAVLGVAAGIAWHRRQAMKRLGGLRV